MGGGVASAYARNDKYLPAPERRAFSAGAKIVHVDRVEWQIIPDPATAAAALQTDEIDWVEQPLIDLMPMLQRSATSCAKFDPLGWWACGVQPPAPAVRQPEAAPSAAAGAGPGRLSVGRHRRPAGIQARRRRRVRARSPRLPTTVLAALTGQRDMARARAGRGESAIRARSRAAVPDRLPDLAGGATMTPRADDVRCRPQRRVVTTDWGTLIAPPRQPGAGGERRLGARSAPRPKAPSSQPDLQQPIRGERQHRLVRLARQPGAGVRGAWFDAPTCRGTEDRRRHPAHALEEVPFLPTGMFFTPTAYRTSITGLQRSGTALMYGVKPA